jgi:hypothetical protein
MMEICGIHTFDLLGEETHRDLDSCPAKALNSPGSPRVGILSAYHDVSNTGFEDGIGARWRASFMVAGLEGDDEGPASGSRSGCFESHPFGVRISGVVMDAVTHDCTGLVEHHGTHPGVWVRIRRSRSLEGAPHVIREIGHDTPNTHT